MSKCSIAIEGYRSNGESHLQLPDASHVVLYTIILKRIILLTIVLTRTKLGPMRTTLRSEIQQTKPFLSREQEIYLQIRRTAELTNRWLSEVLKAHGLSTSTLNVLRILRGARPEAISSARISERMVARDPDLTRLLDKLEKAGLVQKQRDEKDRRVVKVGITPEGVRVCEAATEDTTVRLKEEFSHMTKKQLDQLADLLELARSRKK